MASLIVPALDEEPYPTLGPQVCDFIEDRAIFGPGDLMGEPAVLSPEKRAIIYRAYEVYPPGHRYAGRRRFKRVGWSVRKGMAKTELLAWVVFAELHPEGPVRCDGFDADREPVGRPVNSPYIPMLAYSKDQVEELAFGVLTAVCEEGPDADLFDVSLERILRLSARGRDDGKAVPLAQSPNSRDGARTTFQAFDEPHRMYLPRIREAHDTMNNNLPKRPAADAWSFYVGTAGQLGQQSIAEDLYHEAQSIARGEVAEPRLFFFHRDAGTVHRGEKNGVGHDLTTRAGQLAAVAEATGPEGEWGPGQFEDIIEVYNRPKADKGYWERVQLNLWVQGDAQAFSPLLVENQLTTGTIPLGATVTAGFDGARFRDATAIVITEVLTGKQQLYALWERPPDVETWEVDPAEVDAVVDQLFFEYDVWRWNGDPPHWLESHANWAGRHPQVEEWFTHRTRAMAFAIRDFEDSLKDGAITFVDDPSPAMNSPIKGESMGGAFARHLGNAGKHLVNIWDTGDENEEHVDGRPTERGRQLFILRKIHQSRKFDAAMAAILSWQARLAALQQLDLTKPSPSQGFKRLY